MSSLFKIGVSQNGNYVIVLDFFKLAISCKQDSWLHSCLDNHMAIYFSIMNPARVFIIGIARKFCKPLIERTKCKFTAPPCWPSNMLKILPEYP